MSPEAFAAYLPQATETRYEAILKAEREHITALRQGIAKMAGVPVHGAETQA